MKPRKIINGVWQIAAIDWDRRLFDALTPLPDGTSYNAYLIQGSAKTALIDTTDPTMSDVLMQQLKDIPKIDYIISHHAEQDHSGCLPLVIQKYPDAKIYTTPLGKNLLMDLLPLPAEKFTVVQDGEILNLGGKTIKFIFTPWVHWPETMSTYLIEDKILFSCDFFGSHLASNQLFASKHNQILEAAKRYYAEIMMPFASMIKKNLEKIKTYEISMIAPSHGPVYDEPRLILDAYNDWVNGQPKNTVVIPYVSMHGSTKIMVNYLVNALTDQGVKVEQFDLAAADIGKLAMSLVDAATVVLGTPTVLIGPHPNVLYAAYLISILRPKFKFATIIGSYGWGGQAVQQLKNILSGLKIELLNPIIIKGFPKDSDRAALENLAALIAQKHQENNFIS